MKNSADILKAIVASEIIYNITFEETIELDFKDYNGNYSIDFQKCKFKKGFTIKGLNTEYSTINIVNCIFGFRLHIKDVKCQSIEIDNCQMNNTYVHAVVCDVLEFKESRSKNFISIYDAEIDQMNVENTFREERGRVIINSVGIKDLNIKAINKINELTIINVGIASISGDYNKVILNLENFKSIDVGAFIKDGDVVRSRIESLEVKDSNFDGNLIIEGCDIIDSQFHRVNSKNGSLKLAEIKLTNSSFLDCSVNNFYWNQINFIKPPDIIRCDLSTLKMANVSWADGERSLKDSFLKEDIKWFYQFRKKKLSEVDLFDEANVSTLKFHIETYRQLKAASIVNHNLIESLAFYRNEMKLYWKLVRIEGGIPWYDRFLVFLNRWTSDFGQNWFLPLIWMSILTALYYFWIEKPTISYYPKDIGNGILEALSYLNPVRKIDMESAKYTQGLDVLFRVLNAYFIYHFIKATRKFGKV